MDKSLFQVSLKYIALSHALPIQVLLDQNLRDGLCRIGKIISDCSQKKDDQLDKSSSEQMRGYLSAISQNLDTYAYPLPFEAEYALFEFHNLVR